MLCLPYRIRGFKNKGGFLTLFWSFSGFLVIHYFLLIGTRDIKYAFVVSLVFYPFAGWLADVHYGRYKVVRNGMWIGLAAVLSNNLILVACRYFDLHKCGENKDKKAMYEFVIYYGKTVIGAVGLVGLSGLQANLLQLGIDQFIDASSIEISSYICWYVWVIFLSRSFVMLTQVCQCQVLPEALSFLSVSIFSSLSVILDIFLSHWLIKEPVVHNPLRLIFQVIKYAVNNRYPKSRSASTYWEDKPYSRIDLGKAKYGGPFTTEQVEDVKTFFRIFLVISVASVLMGLCIVLDVAFHHLMLHYKNGGKHEGGCPSSLVKMSGKFWEACYMHEAVEGLANLLMVGLIPIIEFLLYPLFRKNLLCAKFGIMYRFLFGIFLLSIYELYLMTLEATAVSYSQNATCFLADVTNNKHRARIEGVSLDYRWLIPSRLFSAGSMYFLVTSGIEFVCAQAPYSMKGLFAGIVYFLSGAASSIALGLWLRTNIRISYTSRTCGIWFYLSVFAFTIFLLGIGVGLVKWYSYRRRDENVHNEQIFAVDYFDRYNSCSRS